MQHSCSYLTCAVLPLSVHFVHTVQQAVDLHFDHRQFPLYGQQFSHLYWKHRQEEKTQNYYYVMINPFPVFCETNLSHG